MHAHLTASASVSTLAGFLALVTTSAGAAPPTVVGCPVFPHDNAWNVRVDKMPVHPLSAQWIASIGATANFHADFSSTDFGFGIPWVDVPGSQTQVPIQFGSQGGPESDAGPYPIPPNAPVEGGSDHHVLVVDRDSCVLYELYAAVKQPDNSWNAYSGAKFTLSSNALRPDGFTSADAAGLPIFAGLVRFPEANAGAIDHALRFTANVTQQAYVWPARHQAGATTNMSDPPMGARFRLKHSVDLSGLSPHAQAIGNAMKVYGIILADNGSPWYVQGEPGKPGADWDDDVLHELDFIQGSDFEAVDTSSWILDQDSGRSAYVFSEDFELGDNSRWSSVVP